MGKKHKLAAKRRWANWTPEQRFIRMQVVANAKQAKMTKAEKTRHALIMLEGRREAFIKKQNARNKKRQRNDSI